MKNHFDESIDYFSILGLHYGAPHDLVKLTYRKLVRRYHPDVSSIYNAQARFQEISAAYEVLTKYREEYCLAYENQIDLLKRTKHQQYKRSTTQSQNQTHSSQTHSGSYQHKRSDKKESEEKHFKQSNNNGRVFGQNPIDGKDRIITYPLSLRYAIRMLRLGSFYLPGIKVQMKFTREVFSGKTFRIKGYGYKGLFGGKNGDYFVKFKIHHESSTFRIENGNVYSKVEVSKALITPGKTLKLNSPTEPVEWLVPENPDLKKELFFPKMGLPADLQNRAGDLYIQIIAT